MLQNSKQMTARKNERSKVRIFGTVKVMHEAIRGRVADISASGMAVDLERPIRITANQIITFESQELGQLTGIVRWCNGSRVGIQYKLTAPALAQISSYFRFFHQEYKPNPRR
jgi:hypothetical protein